MRLAHLVRPRLHRRYNVLRLAHGASGDKHASLNASAELGPRMGISRARHSVVPVIRTDLWRSWAQCLCCAETSGGDKSRAL
jgi:hypothetical protein